MPFSTDDMRSMGIAFAVGFALYWLIGGWWLLFIFMGMGAAFFFEALGADIAKLCGAAGCGVLAAFILSAFFASLKWIVLGLLLVAGFLMIRQMASPRKKRV